MEPPIASPTITPVPNAAPVSAAQDQDQHPLTVRKQQSSNASSSADPHEMPIRRFKLTVAGTHQAFRALVLLIPGHASALVHNCRDLLGCENADACLRIAFAELAAASDTGRAGAAARSHSFSASLARISFFAAALRRGDGAPDDQHPRVVDGDRRVRLCARPFLSLSMPGLVFVDAYERILLTGDRFG